jgi:hypothetical protein
MENKVVEAVRESVEALRSSLLEELWQLRSRVDLMEEKFDCVVMATAASISSRLHQDADDDSDVGQNWIKNYKSLVFLLMGLLQFAVNVAIVSISWYEWYMKGVLPRTRIFPYFGVEECEIIRLLLSINKQHSTTALAIYTQPRYCVLQVRCLGKLLGNGTCLCYYIN